MKSTSVILEMLFWMLAAAVAIAAAGTVIGFAISPPIGALAAIGVVAFLPLFVRLARVIRRRRAAMTLGYLEQAVRLNLPLSRYLRAAQQSETGRLGDRLAQVRSMIEGGAPIGMALESTVPEVSDREVSIIATGERVGRLPQALARVVNEYVQATREQGNADAAFYRAYPLVMLVVLGTVVSLFCVYVMPKYGAIFRDFGTKLPPVTQWTLDVARTVGAELAFVVAVVVLISSGLSMWQAIHPVRFAKSFFRQARDYVAWFTPIPHGIERDRGWADVFELLSDALSAGVPMDRALIEAGELGINIVLRDRIDRWERNVSAGATIADAARTAGLPPLIVGMLASARDAQTIVDVCGFLARYYRSRFSRTAAILHGVSIPAIVLIFGFLVACAALSMFLPMISLIEHMSSASSKWRL